MGAKQKKANPRTATVSSAYAQTNFGELLKEVKKGCTVTIQRYKKPVAVLSPPPRPERDRPQFGMVKGIKIVDPNWADPMTEDELDKISADRY